MHAGSESSGRLPLVSVIIAAFRAEAMLDAAVSSLQRQTHDHWEALIIDDASDDGTWAKIESLAAIEPRVRGYRLAVNGGPAAARNAGLEHARGDWVTVLDADDAYLPGRIEALLHFAVGGRYDLVFDNLAVLSRVESAAEPFWPAWPKAGTSLPLSEFLFGCSGASRKHYGWLKPFVSSRFLRSSGVRYDGDLRRGEDFLFHARLMVAGGRAGKLGAVGYMYNVPDPHSLTNASKRNHGDSLTATHRLKAAGEGRFRFAEVIWLHLRLWNYGASAEWAEFKGLLRRRRLLHSCRFLLDNPSLMKNMTATLGARLLRMFS